MVGLSKKVFDPITKKACIIFAENFHNEEIKRGYADLVDEDRTKFRKEMVKECVSNGIIDNRNYRDFRVF